MNVIVRLEFELAYYDSAVHHFNHFTTSVAFSYTCSCRIHSDAMNNRRRKTSLEKYLRLTLLQGFEKGYSRFAYERELETDINCNILTPTLMAVNVVSFSFSRCSTGGPEAHSAGWWLSLLHLISIFSGPQFIRAPSPFGMVWVSLPLRSNWNSNSN